MDWDLDIIQPIPEEDFALEALPDLSRVLVVPRLLDKPQNPVLDTLYLNRKRLRCNNTGTPVSLLPEDEEDEALLRLASLQVKSRGEDIWREVADRDLRLNKTVTWDSFCAPCVNLPNSSPFLTQHSPHVFAAVRRIYDTAVEGSDANIIQVTPHELLASSRNLLAGLSSTLYLWDTTTRQFCLRNVQTGNTGVLDVLGLDYGASQSVVDRFIAVGTLTRRLDSLVTAIWQSSSKNEPAVHAFTHALSSILTYVKSMVSNMLGPQNADINSSEIYTLTALWIDCAAIESQLEALAQLCGQSLRCSSSQTNKLPHSATDLLSIIYHRLEMELNNTDSSQTSAMFAFLLTSVSRHYFYSVCRSVGYNNGVSGRRSFGLPQLNAAPLPLTDENQESGHDINTYHHENHNFPSFFSQSFTRTLLRARQSLRLLRVAQPEHPILHYSDRAKRDINWIWTQDDIDAAWNSRDMVTTDRLDDDLVAEASANPIAVTAGHDPVYMVDIQEFAQFDLEPCVGHHVSTINIPSNSSASTFATFLRVFPNKLPSSTPCLSNLTELILSPLITHAEDLSTALVKIFLAPSKSYLSLQHHVALLRSYLLLTSPAFKTRLQAALFSTSSDGNEHVVTARIRPDRERNIPATWVIGLAPALTENTHWPPAGADLSYLLRTVIIDSLDDDYLWRQDETRPLSDAPLGRDIYQEADWRLGFAIRDLPIGAGQAKWLNPRSIEALDFLYMNYQPPPALEVLFPPATLSKYHRLFTFNLRLLRVENVVKALFRMSTPRTSPLFHTITPSQKLFEHFRFLSSSFVTTLSSYIYDTAVGGNIDAFITKLTLDENTTLAKAPSFSDIFALADSHSDIMDDILGACLLRSRQKAVGDMLRNILHTILEFGLLMSDLKRGGLEEYQVVAPLEQLFTEFRSRMIKFVHTLRSLVDKSTGSSRLNFADMRLQLLSGHHPSGFGVVANLYDLLIRLDTTQWWAKERTI